MKSAEEVAALVEKYKDERLPIKEVAWKTALACVGWPYVFGAWGEECTVRGRKNRARDDHPTIRSACQVLREKNPKSSCDGCKWYPDDMRVRMFDCRGFTDWILKQYGIDLQGEGATGQWNTESNWAAKGLVADGIPQDQLVCLFYPVKDNKKKMAHTGFGFNGETCECSSGVQHFKTMNAKWTHWALPKGAEADFDPEKVQKPTLRRGSKGEYVTLAQTLLNNRGYNLGRCGIDGDFGAATQAAVKQFQEDWNLVQDGVVGPMTWKYLESTPTSQLYSVTVYHLTKSQAGRLKAEWPDSSIAEE